MAGSQQELVPNVDTKDLSFNDNSCPGTEGAGMGHQEILSLNLCIRKSSRPRKTPVHLSESITDAGAIGESIQKRLLKTAAARSLEKKQLATKQLLNKPKQPNRLLNLNSGFQCDMCGSRYVVNPMRRGNKVKSSQYKATPRHKVDPETQKILTLCNACGLKFGRNKKGKNMHEDMTEEDLKKFRLKGEQFAKELSTKLENEAASRLFCSHMKKTPCGCIQKYICGSETASVDEILARGKELLEISLKAIELKKLKCYDPVETKKGASKIGLGNGHRKSREFEEFVLKERVCLRDQLKFCEKGTQKILSYSNNFLHKRMKTDPEKGIRIERQKGKAALGILKPVQDLPLEDCCVDNCVRMALTHGRLLEVWRERASTGQVEARRVLAEMLTPSGGNRANCYRFVSLVTGCSHTTIGKVNEQMKTTGGDREPPEHGLKKYWKDNPKQKKLLSNTAAFVPSYQILQTAANSAGLSTMIQGYADKMPEPQTKKIKRQSRSNKNENNKNIIHSFASTRLSNGIGLLPENNEANTTNLQNISATVLAVHGNCGNGGFISIPAGLANGNTITLPSGITLQATQQQLQQQQLQLQIQLLQQQLQQNQAANLAQHTNENTTEYMVNVSNPIEQHTNNVQPLGTPVVVQSVTSQPVVQNVVTQSLQERVQSETVLPTIVAHTSGGLNFVQSATNVNLLQPQNDDSDQTSPGISLLTTPIKNPGEISLLAPTNNRNVFTQQANSVENSVITTRTSGILGGTLRPIHLITSQSPTMAISPAISLHNPTTFPLSTVPTINPTSLPLSTVPTMLLTSSSSNEAPQPHQQLFIQSTPHRQQTSTEHVLIQRPGSSTTEHVVIQQPTQSSQQVVLQQSPPISQHPSTDQASVNTSFNADAFFTSGGISTYAVINNGAYSQIQPRQVANESDTHGNSIQVPFYQS